MSRHEAAMWAEAMEHIGHSSDCATCHGAFMWRPADLVALLDADYVDKHNGAADCPCILCTAGRRARDDAARDAPWCGTCNPAVRTLVTGSPEYRREFERLVREGGDMDGIPVPAAIDPTVKP